jgi:protein-L-isoaspartate(D-aspartate) O-methyltransferase
MLVRYFTGDFLRLQAAQQQVTPNAPPAETNRPADTTRPRAGEIPRPTHNHPAFRNRILERNQMVSRYIQKSFFSKAITDPNVLAALRTVPRHAFVLPEDLHRAYNDYPLHIGFGQTISQPYIVAYMTEALELTGAATVLEVGTGSGYQAAICAEIARRVFSIEIIEPLAKPAAQRLQQLGYINVSVKTGDGYFGWPENAPFDAVIVTAAAGFIPPPLLQQLKPGGRMILPVGSPFGPQMLVLVTKSPDGQVQSKSLLPVSFVPMLGEVTERHKP